MNTEEIINKYKEKEEIVLCKLSDGGIVIGEEVDSGNHLYYVIKRNDVLSVEAAVFHTPVERIIHQPTHSVTVSMNQVQNP